MNAEALIKLAGASRANTEHDQLMEGFPELLGQLCIEIECASNIASLREALRSALPLFNADFFLLILRPGARLEQITPAVLTNYPKGFRIHYNEIAAWSYDPVLFRASRTEQAFAWDSLYMSPQQLTLQQAQQRYGIDGGITASMRGPNMSYSVLSFSGRRSTGLGDTYWNTLSSAASVLTAQCHRTLSRIVIDTTSRPLINEALSDMEQKTIAMLALGHTHQAVADNLGVKIDTIRFYLNRAAVKLNVESRKAVVAAAILRGLVDTRAPLPLLFNTDC